MAVMPYLNQGKSPNRLSGAISGFGSVNSSPNWFTITLTIDNKPVTVLMPLAHINYVLKITGLAPAGLVSGDKENQLLKLNKNLSKATGVLEVAAIGTGNAHRTEEAADPSKIIFYALTGASDNGPIHDWPQTGPVDSRFLPVPVPKGENEIRIGYATFDLPIEFIQQDRNSYIEQKQALRENGTIKIGTGFSFEDYTISYTATNYMEVESAVKEVVELVGLNPFITCSGGPFGERPGEGDIRFQEFVAKSVSVSTVPGYPNCLTVELNLSPFLFSWYCPQSVHERAPAGVMLGMDDVTCWPLVKLWSQTRSKSILQRANKSKLLNGKFSLGLPSQEVVNRVNDIASTTRSINTNVDVSTLMSLSNLLQDNTPGIEARQITSPNIKVVKSTEISSIERICVLKVGNKEVFDALLKEKSCIGLADWSKFRSNNFMDDNGKYIPASSIVDIDRINSKVNSAIGFTTDKLPANTYSFISIDLSNGKDLTKKIGAYMDTLSFDRSPTLNKSVQNDKANAINSPWEFFGVVLNLNAKNTASLGTTVDNLVAKEQARHVDTYATQRTQLNEVLNDIKDSSILKIGYGGPDPDAIIESINAHKRNGLSTEYIDGLSLPMFQYMGGGNTEITVKGKCFTKEMKAKIEHIKDEFDARCFRSYLKQNIDIRKDTNGVPFLRINNEIADIFGVNFVMPLAVSFSNSGEPGVWDFELTLLEYDPRTQVSERIKFLHTTLQDQAILLNYQNPDTTEQDPIVAKALEYFSLQYSLAQEEVYPDLQLPTTGELDYWISVLRDEATFRLKNKGRRPDLPLEASTYIDICEEFFQDPYCLTQMAAFKAVNTTHGNQGVELEGYVDPDFYIDYDVNHSWGASFDKIALGEVGAPTAKLEGKGADTIYRLFSPMHDLYTVHTNYIGNPVSNIAEESVTGLTNSYPEANRDRAIAGAQKAASKMDANPQAWWVKRKSTVTTVNTDGAFTDDNPAYLTGSANTSMVPLAGIDPAALDATINKVKNAGIDFRKFLSYDWRRKALQSAALAGASYGIAGYDFIHDYKDKDSGFLVAAYANPTEGLHGAIEGFLNNFVFTSKTSNDVVKSLPPDAILVLDALNDDEHKSFLLSADNKPSNLEGIFNVIKNQAITKNIDLNSNVLNFTNSHQVDGLSQVQKTLIQSANYESAWSLTGKVFPEPSGEDKYEQLYTLGPAIDFYANKYKIDPNIIRAFILRTLPTDSGVGYLRLDAKVASTGLLNDGLDTLCSTYGKYLGVFNQKPTLALAATYIEVSPSGRADKWTGSTTSNGLIPSVNSAFLKASAAPPSTTQLVQLQEAVNASGIGPIIEDYWTAYIEISRVFGSHIHAYTANQKDALFDPLSPYILMGSGVGSKFVDTKLSPTGKVVRIDLSNNEVFSNNADRRSRGVDVASSKEVAASSKSKIQFGLEPHTEGAIYSAMMDARKHCAFGRLVRAFPAHKVIIINEGFFFAEGSKKLWDQFYTRGGISSIEVIKNQTMASDQAFVTFSNMFLSLTRNTHLAQYAQDISVDANNYYNSLTSSGVSGFFTRLWQNIIRKNPDQEFIRTWQYNHLQQLAMAPGARIQIKMGYGSNASLFPTVFNGRVMTCPIDKGEITIVAQGDGGELEKPITDRLKKIDDGYAFNSSTGLLGAGTEPAYIVATSMIPSKQIISSVTGGRFGKHNNAPHFGDILFSSNGGNAYSTPEFTINMYGAAKSKIEQGWDAWSQALNKNALYNWDSTNLISVSVKEPTIWKTANVCRMSVMDFIARPEPFHTRSTLFFGKWWYPFNYAYDPSILKFQKLGTAANTIKDLEVDNSVAKKVATKTYITPDFKSLNNAPKPVVDWIDEQHLRDSFIKLTDNNPGSIGISSDREFTILFKGPNNGVFGYVLTYSGYTQSVVKVKKLSSSTTTTVDQNILQQNELFSDPVTLRNVENLVGYLKWKTYVQCWPATTGVNLISNNVIPDASTVYTDARGISAYNAFFQGQSVSKTFNFSVDSDIVQAERKTLLVDTGLLVTNGLLGRNPLERIGRAIGAFMPVVGEGIQETPDTPEILNSVLSGLCDSVSTMYSGLITITGEGAIKPHDLLLVNDVINALEGPVWVREVIHSMTIDRGYITMITPGCVALPATSTLGEKIITSYAAGPLAKVNQYILGKTASAISLGYINNRLISPFNRRIDDLVTATKNVDSDITNGFEGLTPEFKSAMNASIDQELSTIGSRFSPFKDNARVRELKKFRTMLNKNEADFVEIAIRAKDLGIALPADVRGANDFKEVVDIILKTKLHLKEHQAFLGTSESFRAYSPAKKAQMLDAEGLRYLEDQLKSSTLGKGGYEKVNKKIDSLLKAIDKKEKTRGELILNKNATLDEEEVTEDGRLLDDIIKGLKKRRTELKNTKGTTKEEIQEIDDLMKEIFSQKRRVTASASANKLAADIADLQAEVEKLRNVLPDSDVSLEQLLQYVQGQQKVLALDEDIAKVINSKLTKEELKALAAKAKADREYAKSKKALEEAGGSVANLASAESTLSAETVALLRSAEAKQELTKGIKASRAAAKAAASAPTSAVRITNTLKTMQGKFKDVVAARHAKRMAEATAKTANVISLLGPQVILRVALEVVRLSIGMAMVDYLNSALIARQAVRVIPLRVRHSDGTTTPVVAGLRGHQGSVIGDDLSFFDNMLENYLGGKDESLGARGVFFLAASLGIEVPEYGNTEIDSSYYQDIRKKFNVDGL